MFLSALLYLEMHGFKRRFVYFETIPAYLGKDFVEIHKMQVFD